MRAKENKNILYRADLMFVSEKLLMRDLFIFFLFRNIHYIERDGQEHYHTLKVFPETLNKKVTLLKYFRNYMNEHLFKVGHKTLFSFLFFFFFFLFFSINPFVMHVLFLQKIDFEKYWGKGIYWSDLAWCILQAGANMVPRDSDEMMRLPFLRTWFRTRSAIVLHLSNGTLQVCSIMNLRTSFVFTYTIEYECFEARKINWLSYYTVQTYKI